MILAFSTSCPRVGVAALNDDGAVLCSTFRMAPRAASQACLELLEEIVSPDELRKCTLILADLGPGSFTGVRVGVTVVQTLGMSLGQKVGGAEAFDLIDPMATVAIPSRKDEVFVREFGAEPYRTVKPPDEAVGYGHWFGEDDQRYPNPELFGVLLDKIKVVEPEQLLPSYLLEPSITISPKLQ